MRWSLLANIVMAWNTAQMPGVIDRSANKRQVVPPELIWRIAPTRLESICRLYCLGYWVPPGHQVPVSASDRNDLTSPTY